MFLHSSYVFLQSKISSTKSMVLFNHCEDVYGMFLTYDIKLLRAKVFVAVE